MKVAILETVKASAGFELEFDRIIIEALKAAGHEPVLYVPANAQLDQNFHIPVTYLSGGDIISYEGAGRLKKIWLSLQREHRRKGWFDAAAEAAQKQEVGAIVLTTATYRYLRALKKSRLRHSTIPVYFIFLGVNPQEKPKFIKKAIECQAYKNIHLCVTTLRDDFQEDRPSNVRLLPPPVMVPESCPMQPEHTPLRIGFFGHYRKGEKNLAWILQALEQAVLLRPVQIVLQAVPTTEADRKDVQALVRQYEADQRIVFITHKLLGDDWYNAIQSVDVVFLPYTAERYRYNWSAIYFTAIGCHKPVLTTTVLNPEVMQQFKIGAFIEMDSFSGFTEQLTEFINAYDGNKDGYKSELQRANERFGKAAFVRNLL